MSAVLWHIPISHFNEKARWALDYKGIEWEGRTPTPGLHMAVALWLTRGAHKTFPVLQLDGRATADSSAIIARLDEYRPEPRLIPADPDERARALGLQDYFDAGLGPSIRLLAFHELRQDEKAMAAFGEVVMPKRLMQSERGRAIGVRMGSAFTQLRYRVASDEAAAKARAIVLAALDRLDRELEASGGTYLVGDRFSVADLTAAALFMPIAQPPEGPNDLEPPPALRAFRDPLVDRPGFRWVLDTYARHRLPAG